MDRRAALVPLGYLSLPGQGPEDVVADPGGRVLTGVSDGRILRVDGLDDPTTARVEQVGEIDGRPLGLELLPDGDLLVCSADGALLRVDPDGGAGAVRVLTESAAGERLRFCSNVVALPDGTLYFTVSSRVHPLQDWMGDIVEHTGTGRLLRLEPGAREAEVVLEGLQFANGLARECRRLLPDRRRDRRPPAHPLPPHRPARGPGRAPGRAAAGVPGQLVARSARRPGLGGAGRPARAPARPSAPRRTRRCAAAPPASPSTSPTVPGAGPGCSRSTTRAGPSSRTPAVVPRGDTRPGPAARRIPHGHAASARPAAGSFWAAFWSGASRSARRPDR